MLIIQRIYQGKREHNRHYGKVKLTLRLMARHNTGKTNGINPRSQILMAKQEAKLTA